MSRARRSQVGCEPVHQEHMPGGWVSESFRPGELAALDSLLAAVCAAGANSRSSAASWAQLAPHVGPCAEAAAEVMRVRWHHSTPARTWARLVRRYVGLPRVAGCLCRRSVHGRALWWVQPLPSE